MQGATLVELRGLRHRFHIMPIAAAATVITGAAIWSLMPAPTRRQSIRIHAHACTRIHIGIGLIGIVIAGIAGTIKAVR